MPVPSIPPASAGRCGATPDPTRGAKACCAQASTDKPPKFAAVLEANERRGGASSVARPDVAAGVGAVPAVDASAYARLLAEDPRRRSRA